MEKDKKRRLLTQAHGNLRATTPAIAAARDNLRRSGEIDAQELELRLERVQQEIRVIMTRTQFLLNDNADS